MKQWLTTLALLAVFATPLLSAETPSWNYRHHKVLIEDRILAEFSNIFSVKPESRSRVLLKDEQGRRWVIRSEPLAGAPEGSGRVTVRLMETDETLQVEVDTGGHIRYAMGERKSFTVLREELTENGTPDLTRSAAAAMLNDSSEEVRHGLARIVEVAQRHSISIWFLGALLSDPFFPELADYKLNNVEANFGPLLREFDPETRPPSAFDSEFGEAYFN